MSVQTDFISSNVTPSSVTQTAESAEIADIKALHEVGWSRQDIILLTLGVSVILLAVAAIIWSVKRLRRGRTTSAAVDPAPIQEHWAVLVARRLDGLPQHPTDFEDVRKFTFELGALLREVIGQLTQQHVLELTSSEIRDRILPLLETSFATEVGDFLARADLILFAKIDPGGEVYESGRNLVRILLQSAIDKERRLDLEVKNASSVRAGDGPS